MRCWVFFLIIYASFCWCSELEASYSAELRTNKLLRKIRSLVPENSDDEVFEEDHIPDELKDIIKRSLEASPDVFTDNRIIGGSVTIPNAYPYQVGLSIKRSSKTSWCGGSILSDEFIVTAAHCVDKVISVTVILGAHERNKKNEAGRLEIVVSKANVILHNKWNRDKLLNDIALVRLGRKIQFTDKIQPIALPFNDESFEGKTGTISGWGHYDKNKKLSSHLRHAQSQIVSNSVCEQRYSSYVKPTNVCLDGSKGYSTCNGDSGGPLTVMSAENEPILVGLTSFGSSQGCSKRFPTVFTRLSKYLAWITENTGIQIKS